MFKTDKKTLENLSFHFDERDISHLKALITNLRSMDALTIPEQEAEQLLKGLDAIGQLKLDGKVYAFHVVDEYLGYNDGVELYLRQGDTLESYFRGPYRGDVPRADETAEFLNEMNISTVYTGIIKDEFLGLPSACDDEDPLANQELDAHDIYTFSEHGIKVVTLDQLI